jgi:hypothetical protein
MKIGDDTTPENSPMNEDPEITALTAVYAALKELDPDAQKRVLEYVAKKVGVAPAQGGDSDTLNSSSAPNDSSLTSRNARTDEEEIGIEGISPVAMKWMRRSALNVEQLSSVFSLGADEIDLIAKSVPGNSMTARTRAVALLKCIAAYLSSGAARITAEQIKEACLHYDAYDPTNHSKYIKALASELSGNKASGYSLTARGMTAATEMIKEMLGIKPGA